MPPLAVSEFQDALGELAARSGEAADRLLSRIQVLSPPEARAFITDAYPELLAPYLAASSDLTVQWYSEQPTPPTRPGVGAFIPEAAPMRAGEQLAISGRWALTQNNPSTALAGNATRQVMNQSRDTVIINAQREGVRWVRQAKMNACGFCKMLATRAAKDLSQYSYRSEGVRRKIDRFGNPTGDYTLTVIGKRGRTRGKRRLGSEYHDHCVPAGTVVSGPPARGAYRRLYEGEVIVIDTASGQQLTITPNHPVLTDNGWVPAGLINSGDNVIRCTSGEARPVAVPDKYQQPALIEDVWGALAVNGLASVPGSTEQFHGDGREGEVEIVGTYGLLGDRVKSTFYQPPFQSIFADAGWTETAVEFSPLGQLASLFPGSLRSANGIMRCGSKSLSLVGICSGHANEVGLTGISRPDSQFDQPSAYYGAAGLQSLGDFQLGQLLFDIELANLIGVKRDPIARRFDPIGFEFSIENGSTYSALGLDLLHGLTGQVEIDRVIDARRVNFSGHVLNLETSEGWYSASSLIVSNCRCTAVPIRDGSYEPPDYVQQWTDEYDAIVAREGTGDLLRISNLMDAGRIRPDRPRVLMDGPDLLTAAAAQPAPPPPPVDLDTPPPGDITATLTTPADDIDRLTNDAMAALEAGDDELADRLFEQARRLELAQEAKQARAARAAARRETVDRDKQNRVLSLIEDEGMRPDEAEAQVYGRSLEFIRRRDFMAQARAAGHVGKGFDDLVAQMHAEYAAEQYWKAEAATNGYMLKPRFVGRFNPQDLWKLPDAKVREIISDEMAEWFDANGGRVTRKVYRQSILDGSSVFDMAMQEDFLQ